MAKKGKCDLSVLRDIPYTRCYAEAGMIETDPGIFTRAYEIAPPKHQKELTYSAMRKARMTTKAMVAPDKISAVYPLDVHHLFEKKPGFLGLNQINDNFIFSDRRNCPVGMIAGVGKSGKTFSVKRDALKAYCRISRSDVLRNMNSAGMKTRDIKRLLKESQKKGLSPPDEAVLRLFLRQRKMRAAQAMRQKWLTAGWPARRVRWLAVAGCLCLLLRPFDALAAEPGGQEKTEEREVEKEARYETALEGILVSAAGDLYYPVKSSGSGIGEMGISGNANGSYHFGWRSSSRA